MKNDCNSKSDPDETEEEMLWRAISENRFNLVKLLIDAQVNINIRNKDGESPLIKVCREGFYELAELLLGVECVEKDAVDTFGGTALMMAIRDNHINIVQLLIENNANVNAVNKFGGTPILIAVCNGHYDCVELLLTREDINAKAVDKLGNTLLHLICTSSSYLDKPWEQLINLLMKHEVADVNHQNENGKTCLHVACSLGKRLDLMLYLIEYCGADVTIQDRNGKVPLDYCSSMQHKQAMKDAVSRVQNSYVLK